jgi:hypothetical protein
VQRTGSAEGLVLPTVAAESPTSASGSTADAPASIET